MTVQKLVEAVDVSKYTGDIDPRRWTRARHAGVGLAIVGAWHSTSGNTNAEDQLRDSRESGMTTAAYVVLNNRDGVTACAKAKSFCGKEWDHLSFVALDCELSSMTPSSLFGAVKALRTANKRIVIYTYWSFWHNEYDNSVEVRDIPLWDARPDHDNSSLDWGHHSPYGGWTKRTGKQYKADDKSLGFLCDRSIFDADWLSDE